jgi:hypothetical protein
MTTLKYTIIELGIDKSIDDGFHSYESCQYGKVLRYFHDT